MTYFGSMTLFPVFAIRRLSGLRGNSWRRLVKQVTALPPDHPKAMAYTLMMRRLSTVTGISSTVCSRPDCAQCGIDLLQRYDGSEKVLVAEYKRTLREIQRFVAIQVEVAARAA